MALDGCRYQLEEESVAVESDAEVRDGGYYLAGSPCSDVKLERPHQASY